MSQVYLPADRTCTKCGDDPEQDVTMFALDHYQEQSLHQLLTEDIPRALSHMASNIASPIVEEQQQDGHIPCLI